MPRPTVFERIRRHRVAVLGVLLFVFATFYRFNALGGALGGFDNDHFVPFVYAKQVQAGEQPLRDFKGVGLQGAWPSLTFELSAWAQSLLGNNLRSEALLSVGGLALAAVITLVATVPVAPAWLAATGALMSIWLAPKLYSYPKVLVLAAAVLLFGRYARHRGRADVAWLGAATAVAFLFRHDLAVYVAVGSAVAIACGAGAWRRGLAHLCGYAAVTIGLLVPTLVFVQRHAGIPTYIEDSVFAVRQEARRTERVDRGLSLRDADGRGVSWSTAFGEQQNAVWWLYYLNLALPGVVLVFVAWPRRGAPREPRVVLAACAVMAIVVAPSFLRGNTGARFGDMAPVTAVLLAGTLAMAFRRPSAGRATAAFRVGVGLLVAAVTAQSVWAVGGVEHELDTSGWSDSPSKIAGQAARRWAELGALPSAYWTGEAGTPTLRAVQYLHACTRPEDRVIVFSYQPELLPLADRRFGGGGASSVPGLLFLYKNQRAMVERWRHEPVPLVLMEVGPEDAHEIPIILEYLGSRYVEAGSLDVDRGRLTVFADRGRAPVRVFGANGLPCFQ